jgi:hAT family C-terminal dimerisation region
MARDYLPIQGSATPSERAFSSGGLTGTKNRNRIDVQIFEDIQILKSAYRNGFIAAVEQAGQHYDALIASLDAGPVAADDLVHN